MLAVHKRIEIERAIDPDKGNVQMFLERLLVEVVAGNYRYFLNEHLAISSPNSIHKHDSPEVLCWPPLLAKEREVSGLFANALATVCPVSRPEQAIRRGSRDDQDVDSAGRMDFLALYGSRHLGLELKRVPVSPLGDIAEKGRVKSHWDTVSKQSKEVMTFMRGCKRDYSDPLGIGLMVIPVSRSIPGKSDNEIFRQGLSNGIQTWTDELSKSLRPDFLALYVPPPEMQVLHGFGKNGDKFKAFPAVFFAAVVHCKAAAK